MFGMGCFWGAERKFWELGDGIHITAVGYAGGHTPNPTYQEVCTGRTGHNEVVLVVYDPAKISYERLLKTFWEDHDPTQGMRQGNDVGTQYRSGIYAFTPAQRQAAEASKAMYGKELKARHLGAITTEVLDAPQFYFAEDRPSRGANVISLALNRCRWNAGASMSALTRGALVAFSASAPCPETTDRQSGDGPIGRIAPHFFRCFLRKSTARCQAALALASWKLPRSSQWNPCCAPA
jgi:methionine-S-sulfoxide reductase